MKALTARTVTLSEFEERFQLHFSEESGDFWEWQRELSPLTDREREQCDRIKTNYTNIKSA
ncbi:MAG: hypothetical protein J7647_02685 [Cyanobacteria bacterium SBLK]|nr:hypothetical protein [Cyanobacteria bacterium SBLK]